MQERPKYVSKDYANENQQNNGQRVDNMPSQGHVPLMDIQKPKPTKVKKEEQDKRYGHLRSRRQTIVG